MFTGIGLIAFVCIFGAGLLGFLLSRLLPASHRAEETQRAVHMILSIVGLLAALVLGLLVASTKTSFDTRSQEIEQFSANLTLLDRELAHFGQDAKMMRDQLRTFTARKIAQTWTDRDAASENDATEGVRLLDSIERAMRALTPQGEVLVEARKNALLLTGNLKQTSRLLSVQQISETPRPFLIAVIFWLSILFLSHTIFAPFNATVIATAFVAAFSVSMAVNLIFDMDRPFTGFVRVSQVPMQQALDRMKP